MSIFFKPTDQDGEGLAVYCTECKTHYTVNPRPIGDSRYRVNLYPAILWEDKNRTTRCLVCGFKHLIFNPQRPPIYNIFIDEDKVKLSVIETKTVITFHKGAKRNVLINIDTKSRLVFNTKSRRIFLIIYGKKGTKSIEDISFESDKLSSPFCNVPSERLEELKIALELNCNTNISSIFKAFKFGSEEVGDSMIAIKNLYKSKQLLVLPIAEAAKSFKLQLASKGIKRLIGEDKLLLVLWHKIGRNLQVDNALKLLPALGRMYLKYHPYEFNENSILDFVKMAPNETDIVRKLIKFFNKCLSVQPSGDIFDNTDFEYKSPFKLIDDIVQNLYSIGGEHKFDDPFNNTTIRQYVYKNEIVRIHEQASLAQNILKEDHQDLPNYPEWNKTINGISFISPKNEIELSAVGIYMHICVGGYGNSIICKRTNVVYALDQLGKSVACIEINNSMSVNQLKAYSNKKVNMYRQECLAYLKLIGCTTIENESWNNDVEANEISSINLEDFEIIDCSVATLEIPVFNKSGKEVRPMCLSDQEILAKRDELVNRANQLKQEVKVTGWNISLANQARKLSEELDEFDELLQAMSH